MNSDRLTELFNEIANLGKQIQQLNERLNHLQSIKSRINTWIDHHASSLQSQDLIAIFDVHGNFKAVGTLDSINVCESDYVISLPKRVVVVEQQYDNDHVDSIY